MRSSILLALIPAVAAHIGLFDPSALDFGGDGFSLVTPLSGKPFDEWWFHGNLNKPNPTSKFALPVGSSVTLELACEKKFTSFGNAGNGRDPCPDEATSKHAGNDDTGSPFDTSLLLGCGLAIAYKSEFKDVKPADFTVFTVNDKCVKDLKTSFDVPSVMPACPSGGCICAWFWQGQSSDDEMYMTGFRCDVQGGSTTATIGAPQPPKYCPNGGCVSGPKQPLYWANSNSNIDYSGDYFKKPAYNSNWGFNNGAQNDIIQGGGSNPTTTTKAATTTKATTTKGTDPTTFITRAKTTLTNVKTVTKTTATVPTATVQCSWPGHCLGAKCSTGDDCSDDLTCNSGVCGKASRRRHHHRQRHN